MVRLPVVLGVVDVGRAELCVNSRLGLGMVVREGKHQLNVIRIPEVYPGREVGAY